MASRRTHISTMIHNRSVSNACSLILVWRQRQRHGEGTDASFVREQDKSCRWTGVMSESQSENIDVTVILIMLALIDITSICQQRSQIIFNWMITATVLINDNSYSENKKSFPWGMAAFASSLISPQADNLSLHPWNKPLSGWKVVNVVFIEVIVNLLTSLSSTWSTISFNFEIFCFPVPHVWKKEAINSGIKAAQIKKWHKHLQLWQSCAI